MIKYPKIHHVGNSELDGMFNYHDDIIVVQEKFDGANFRFWLEDGEVKFGSRNVDYVTGIDDGWGAQVEYLRKILEGKQLDQDIVYCGEATKKHSLDYKWDEIPPFIGFDVVHKDTGLPLDHGYASKEFDRLELATIETVWVGTVRDWLKEEVGQYIETSAYRQGAPEGIVIKNYGRQNVYGRPLFGKLVTEQFKEKKDAKFGSCKVKVDDTPYVVETYVTEARVRKLIMKLTVDEGKPLGRSIMGDLIKRTMRDVLEENIVDIWLDKKVSAIDFGLMARLVPSKCLPVLDKVMTEKAFDSCA